MAINKLSDTFIKNLKYNGQKKYHDGGGLYIDLTPINTKHFRMRYFYDGKEKVLSFGAYPVTTLAQAREMRDEAKKLLAADIDPGVKKKKDKENEIIAKSLTFEILGQEWYQVKCSGLAPVTQRKIRCLLNNDIYPYIGNIALHEIKAKDVLAVCKRIEDRVENEYAHRALQICGRIFRYAVSCDKAEYDVTASLKGALKPQQVKHYPTITDPKKVGELLRAIDDYQGDFIVACALKLLPLVFTRPGELRGARWPEFNLKNAEWHIPKERMKIKTQKHIVPLSRQAIEIIMKLQELTGTEEFLFPGPRTVSRPISDVTLTAGLRRMGFTSSEIVPHGFRAMASTLLNEQGYNRDWIERQLAHSEGNKVRAAYNYAEFLPERRQMMQEWADYLDELKMTN